MGRDPANGVFRVFFTRRLASFRYAFAGIAYVLRSQRNAWIHSVATFSVALAGFWLDLSRNEWALITITIGVVWAAEIVNTAIESTIDLIAPQPDPLAKIAKDCAAAAVLVTAVMAVIVGLLVLGPALEERLGI